MATPLLRHYRDMHGTRDAGPNKSCWMSLFDEFIYAREVERHEISRFIHDTVAQDLVALALTLEQQERAAGGPDSGRALGLVERCCRDIRLLSYMLAPPVLEEDGCLIEAMENHVCMLAESGVFDIDFRAEMVSGSFFMDAAAVLFAAVHEFTAKAITNRSNKQLAIVLRRDGQSVELEIRGYFGFKEAGDRDYPEIRERVARLGGRIEIIPDFVHIMLPEALTV